MTKEQLETGNKILEEIAIVEHELSQIKKAKYLHLAENKIEEFRITGFWIDAPAQTDTIFCIEGYEMKQRIICRLNEKIEKLKQEFKNL